MEIDDVCRSRIPKSPERCPVNRAGIKYETERDSLESLALRKTSIRWGFVYADLPARMASYTSMPHAWWLWDSASRSQCALVSICAGMLLANQIAYVQFN